jgi:hypothetical protein
VLQNQEVGILCRNLDSRYTSTRGAFRQNPVSPSTHKKVILRKMNQDVIHGWVNPAAFLGDRGVELLTLDGQATVLPYGEIKAVHFVREFDADGDRLERKQFTSRPKLDGLWLRMRFKDDEVLEGILANNLLQLDSEGFTITPPDPYANSTKVFVPRAALAELRVLGVIGSPVAPARRRRGPPKEKQIGLFGEEKS